MGFNRSFSALILGAVAMLTLASCTTGPKSTDSTTGTTTVVTSPPATQGAPPPNVLPVGPTVFTPLVGSVIAAPIPVPASDGKVHLAYEMELTNTMGQEVTLTSIGAMAGDKTLVTLTGEGLSYWTRVLGNTTPTAKIGPGQTALVWLDVTVDEPSDVPADLVHTVSLTLERPIPGIVATTVTETLAPTRVDTAKPVTISPPLRGPGWIDGGGCCTMTAHRTAINPLNGQLWGPERFAIDYVQLAPDGKIFNGDVKNTASFAYFGADVYAVADGPVVAVVDNLPEQVPGTNPSGLPLDQYGGNHIVQDIGGGNYAFYAHLKTGSIKVKVGDTLNNGQIIASVGNSGNSAAPHLHFHIMSTPEPLRSNGLPFVLSSFRLDSRIASDADLDKLLDTGGTAVTQQGFTASDQTNVMPLDLDVMTYPAG